MTTPIAQGPVDVNVRGWMPIETAPVATRLMFWWRPIKPNPYAECCVIGNLCYQYETGERNGKWWNDALGGEQDIWHLTHWMPLPDAPNVELTGAGTASG